MPQQPLRRCFPRHRCGEFHVRGTYHIVHINIWDDHFADHVWMGSHQQYEGELMINLSMSARPRGQPRRIFTYGNYVVVTYYCVYDGGHGPSGRLRGLAWMHNPLLTFNVFWLDHDHFGADSSDSDRDQIHKVQARVWGLRRGLYRQPALSREFLTSFDYDVQELMKNTVKLSQAHETLAAELKKIQTAVNSVIPGNRGIEAKIRDLQAELEDWKERCKKSEKTMSVLVARMAVRLRLSMKSQHSQTPPLPVRVLT
ncbi:hypothetical protein C8A03DRAFT_35526 [Achaetomium macrosporum]|uniref:Uncharacterized protein n=1 Tax=Achaetomium macrosporum TaxID=79813 RepID=A0AAN7C885_9PEZI|nr:hypothetical protein C8A03DRAFT_35526 [Achaetomium macrosporum]